MYAYSLVDKTCAKHILCNRSKIDQFGTPIFGRSFISWAIKVLRWFSRFNQVLRHYARFENNGVVIAVKAIWANLKTGISLVAMLRELSKYEPLDDLIYCPTKTNFADAISLINPKVSKQYLRAKCRRIADALQSRSI